MPKAIWNDVVLAESDTYEEVEGNIYFPPVFLLASLPDADAYDYFMSHFVFLIFNLFII